MNVEGCKKASSRSRSRALEKWVKEDVFLTSWVLKCSSHRVNEHMSQVHPLGTKNTLKVMLEHSKTGTYASTDRAQLINKNLHGVISILAGLILLRIEIHTENVLKDCDIRMI